MWVPSRFRCRATMRPERRNRVHGETLVTETDTAALASLGLTMALTGCQQAEKPVEQAAADKTRPPDPVRIVHRSTYSRGSQRRCLVTSVERRRPRIQVPLPLLREGESGQWPTKDEPAPQTARRRVARAGDRPIELTKAQEEAKRRARRHGMVGDDHRRGAGAVAGIGGSGGLSFTSTRFRRSRRHRSPCAERCRVNQGSARRLAMNGVGLSSDKAVAGRRRLQPHRRLRRASPDAPWIAAISRRASSGPSLPDPAPFVRPRATPEQCARARRVTALQELIRVTGCGWSRAGRRRSRRVTA